MLTIKVKIYDEADSTKTQEAVDTINEYVSGEDITNPWAMFNFEVEEKVLGADFSSDDMETLFPGYSEYPQISFAQGNEDPNEDSKFQLNELYNALRTLSNFIR